MKGLLQTQISRSLVIYCKNLSRSFWRAQMKKFSDSTPNLVALELKANLNFSGCVHQALACLR